MIEGDYLKNDLVRISNNSDCNESRAQNVDCGEKINGYLGILC